MSLFCDKCKKSSPVLYPYDGSFYCEDCINELIPGFVDTPIQPNIYSDPSDWRCNVCSAMNKGVELQCWKCSAQKSNKSEEDKTESKSRTDEWVCPYCNAINEELNENCWKCYIRREIGSPIIHNGTKMEITEKPEAKNTIISINCPLCGDDKNVQKVSAVYDFGISTSKYGGPISSVSFSGNHMSINPGWSSGTIRSSSDLAKKIAPPKEPYQYGTPLKVPLGCILTIICSILILVFLSMTDNGPTIQCILPLALVLILSIIFIRNGNEEKRIGNEKYNIEHKRWVEEMNEWNRLYYCHKHDIEFDPQTGTVYSFTRR